MYVHLSANQTYRIIAINYEERDITLDLTVKECVPPEMFTILLPERIECYSGDYISMDTSFAPEGSSKQISWSSTNADVASVCANGDIVIGEVGTAIVTGTTPNGLSDSIEIVVVEKPGIELDKEYEVNIEIEYGGKYFDFIPEKSGYYSFNINSVDYVYTAVKTDEDGYIYGFSDSFKCYFEEGVVYQIEMSMNYVPTGSFSFVVTETVGVKSVEIITLPERMEYIEGNEEFEYFGFSAKVTLEDGTFDIFDYYDDETVLGYSVDFKHIYDAQDKYEYTLVIVGNAIDEFQFIIKENNVESIELLSGGIELIENSGGYYTEDDNGNSYYRYNYSLDDISIKINYIDSESVVASLGERVDGYYVDWYDDQYWQHWVVGGEQYITAYYLGAFVKIPVSIVETPVEKIVVNSAPSKVYYKYDLDSGWIYTDGSFELDAYNYEGLSFTVQFKDGSTKTYTNEDIDEYDRIDGYDFSIDYDWTADIGEVEVTASYMGVDFTYYIEYNEFPYEVENIKVTKLPDKVDFEQHFFPDFVGLVFEISYADGSVKTVEITEANALYETNYVTDSLITKVYIDDFALCIEENYGSKEKPFVIFYGGVYCEFGGFNYTPLKEIDSLTTSGTVETLQVIVNYADGTSESLDFKGVIDSNDDIEFIDGYITTPKGLIPYHIFFVDDEDDIEAYVIYAFGTYAIFEVDDLLGDVNGDGTVNAADVAVLKKFIAGNLDESDAEGLNTDTDGNTITNVADLALLKKIVVGLA